MSRSSLYAFVTESNMIEGIHREPTALELLAHERFLMLDNPEVQDMVELVSVLQPDARLRDNMSVPGVRVGNHIAPPSGPEIREQLDHILKRAKDDWNLRMAVVSSVGERHSIWRIHCEYETLHPFTDGNGRSGRALWLWCQGGRAPLGFLHQFYYQTLSAFR